VNVIVSDIRGVLPLYDHVISFIGRCQAEITRDRRNHDSDARHAESAVIEADEFYSRLAFPLAEVTSRSGSLVSALDHPQPDLQLDFQE